MPPELMALLGGGNSAPSAPESSGGSEDEPISLLNQMIDSAKRYLDVEPDEEDKATMTKILSQLQQYLAKDQADQDGMLGGKLSPRAVRKAAGGPPA